MLSVETYVETCTAHRLLNYNGRCAHLHGHNYKWVAGVTELVNAERQMQSGIFVDFADMKALLNKLVDIFDHATVLEEGDPLIEPLISGCNRLIVLNAKPTAENLAWLVASQLYSSFKLPVFVTAHETSKCNATYNFHRGDECPVEIVGVYNV